MPKDANEIFRQRLQAKLDAAITKAIPLALESDFDAAEKLIHEVDQDIYGGLAKARMYIGAIAALGGKSAVAADRQRIQSMFQRAVALRESSYPMAHTRYEADAYEAASSKDRSQVVDEIGFDPCLWSGTDS